MADSWSQLLRPRMKGLKLMGPAVYYLTNPIFAMVSVYLVCASVVYGLVPLANKFGVHFNPKAKRQKATRAAIEKLSMCLEPLLPGLGLTWEDVKDCTQFLFVIVDVAVDSDLTSWLTCSSPGGLQESGVLETATLESIEDGIEAPHEFIEGAMDAS